MLSIDINTIWTHFGIQRLKTLARNVESYAVGHATCRGSGAVVNDLQEIHGTVLDIKGDFLRLIEETTACLENYENRMTDEDQRIADSLKGEDG